MCNSKVARVSLLLALYLSAAGCAKEEMPVPLQAAFDVKQTMTLILDPATDVIWGAAGSIVTAEGETDLAPTSDEGWLAVEHAAAVVAESGNLLMMQAVARGDADWQEISRGLTAVGMKALAAAKAKDDEELFKVGGELYQVCVSCHQIYLPKDQ